MYQEEINDMAAACQEKARQVLAASGIARIWEAAGCRVSLVGSLRMGLLASHRDIDLHVYSCGITPEGSFAVMTQIAAIPDVTEIRCVNLLHTGEHCMEWHVFYQDRDGETWQFDIIHIEAGTEYDGYFERMADRIVEVMTPQQRDTILRLKFSASAGCAYHGAEYYEAVIADGVSTLEEMERWVAAHRSKPFRYWIP